MKKTIIGGAALLLIGSGGCKPETLTIKSAAGIAKVNDSATGRDVYVDATIGQKDCEAALMSGGFSRAQAYVFCLNIGQMNPAVMGQQLAPPMPLDINRDGNVDVMQYANGMWVPTGLYTHPAFQGVNWPSAYASIGVTPEMRRTQVLQQFGYYVTDDPTLPRGYIPGYAGDFAHGGTPERLVTKGELDEAVGPLYEQVDAHGTFLMEQEQRGKEK